MREDSISKRAGKADDGMQEEYDFSYATRRRFYRESGVLVPPVHLEPEVPSELLKKGIELIEAASSIEVRLRTSGHSTVAI